MTERDLIDGEWDAELADRLADWRAGRSDAHDLAELAALLRRDPSAIDQALASSALAQALRHAPAHRQRRPATWMPLLAAALLLALVGGGWWALSRSTPSPLMPAEDVALVTGDGQDVGSEFRFERDGAELAIAERARFTGRSGTHVRIAALGPDIELELLSGQLTSTAATGSGGLRIRTPAGVVQTLGTRFIVEMLPEEPDMSARPFLVTVLSGAVLVSGAWGERRLAAAEEADATRFPPADEAPERERLPRLAYLEQALTVDFRGIPLPDAITFLADHSQTNLVISQEVISGPGVPFVTLQAEAMPLGRVLELVAWQTDQAIAFHDEAWFVTDAADAPTRRVIYDPRDLGLPVAHPDDLADALQHLLQPVIDDQPAPVTISDFEGRLALEAPDRVHWFLADLFDLARNLDAGIDGALPLIAPRFGPPSTELEAALGQELAFQWQGKPLNEIADWLRDKTGLTVVIHPSILGNPRLPPITLSGTMSASVLLRWLEVQTGLAIFTSGDEILIASEAPLRFQPFALTQDEADNPDLIATVAQQLGATGEPAWTARLGRVLLVEAALAEDAEQLLAELRLLDGDE